MTSNLLGDVNEQVGSAWRGIISTAELVAREGVDLHKGMNFRKEPQLSVFLSLPSHSGEYHDLWDEGQLLYIYEGHDSTTVESGRSVDQLLMYESGRLTDNGKFVKEANAYKDGIRKEPHQIQVYEKLEAGAWYDKGIFNLVDSKHVQEGGRKVFKFHLRPADAELSPKEWDRYRAERLLPVMAKAEAWQAAKGRCTKCRSQSDLHFIPSSRSALTLRCALHL